MAINNITDTSPGYERRIKQWRKVRDVIDGEDAVKDRGEVYLPKPQGMTKKNWELYLQRADFYAVSERTLRGLVGLVFRTDPVTEVPPRLESLLEAASPEGFTLKQLLREAEREVLSLGRYGVLVDLPRTESTTPIPYLATWQAEQIFDWEEVVDVRTGVRRLVRVAMIEESSNAEEKTMRVIRELAIEGGVYVQRIYEEVEPENSGRNTRARGPANQPRTVGFLSGNFELRETVVPTRFGQPLPVIPFFFINTYDMRTRTDKPPMLDLANKNLAHYRNSADYEMALHLIASPTPYAFGMKKEDKPTSIGPTQLWHSASKDVKVGMLEFTGQGVSTIRVGMRDKEQQMAVLGARLIANESDRENIAAETVRLESREEMSVLMAGTETVEEAFSRAVKFAAFWAGANPDAVKIGLNRDFIETRLEPQEIVALVQSWQSKAISRDTLHANLQRGEIMDAERTAEDEADRIAEEDAAGMGPPAPTPPGGGASPSNDGDGEDTEE